MTALWATPRAAPTRVVPGLPPPQYSKCLPEDKHQTIRLIPNMTLETMSACVLVQEQQQAQSCPPVGICIQLCEGTRLRVRTVNIPRRVDLRLTQLFQVSPATPNTIKHRKAELCRYINTPSELVQTCPIPCVHGISLESRLGCP